MGWAVFNGRSSAENVYRQLHESAILRFQAQEGNSMLQQQLTKRQQRVFNYIVGRINKDHSPTIREIAKAMDYSSPNGVVCHLRALEKKGLIKRSSNKSRSIMLTNEANDEIEGLPLAGRVAAGTLVEAIEQNERINLGPMWQGKGNFVLEVDGDSMIEAQIASGDYVVVKSRRTASKGDMVVARTPDGEATLKYWFPEKNRIRLQPANKRMKPIYSKDARVIGVVIGVVRKI